MPAGTNRYVTTVMGHTRWADRLLIRTAAARASIGDNGGHIRGSALLPSRQKASLEMGHAVVTDTNHGRSG